MVTVKSSKSIVNNNNNEKIIKCSICFIHNFNSYSPGSRKDVLSDRTWDGQDALAINKDVVVTLSIISQEDASETVFYRETQRSQTNSSGLVSLEIGSGYDKYGSLSSIDWPNGNYSLKTQYVLVGINVTYQTITALNSYVYSFHANDSEQVSGFRVSSDVPSSSVFTDSQDASQVSLESTVLPSSNVQEAIEAHHQSIEITGDMKRTVYDAQEDGIIDNAHSINGFTLEASVPSEASFSDSQKASEVNLATAIDIDGDNNNETTVELALNKLNDLLDDLWEQHDLAAADTEAEAIEETALVLQHIMRDDWFIELYSRNGKNRKRRAFISRFNYYQSILLSLYL